MKYEFMQKAEENLTAAKISFQNGLYNASANRAYYAAFQAAKSTLLNQRVKKEKRAHKQVQAEFSRMLIRKRKVYPGRLKSYLMQMQIVRDRADYSELNVNKKTAWRQFGKAEEMVTLIKRELGND